MAAPVADATATLLTCADRRAPSYAAACAALFACPLAHFQLHMHTYVNCALPVCSNYAHVIGTPIAPANWAARACMPPGKCSTAACKAAAQRKQQVTTSSSAAASLPRQLASQLNSQCMRWVEPSW